VPGNQDPYKSFNFVVEIEGVAVADFSEVSGLSSETTVIEYRTGAMRGSTRKLPGLTKYSNITLKRGITSGTELWEWRQHVVDGEGDRRSVSIVLRDDQGQELLRWNLVNAWPCKWQGPSFDAKGNEVAIETLELAIEGLSLATS